MGRTEKQVYSMDQYLKWFKNGVITGEFGVRRLSGQWDKRMVSELLVTVLNGSYVPPVILGETADARFCLIDGMQRSVSLFMFRYGNYRIASNVEDSLMPYTCLSQNDGLVDIRRKTFDELPEELKKAFDEYQIETVIYRECSFGEEAQLVRCYNNHVPLNKNQKAFTYAQRFAAEIREIAESRFFADCGRYTERERMNGTIERVVMESVMCMFHLKHWKKQPGQMAAYLNGHASKQEFEVLGNHLCRLEKMISEDLSGLFTAQDSFIWFTLFHIFCGLGMQDKKFTAFLSYVYKKMDGREIRELCMAGEDKGDMRQEHLAVKQYITVLEKNMEIFLNADLF